MKWVYALLVVVLVVAVMPAAYADWSGERIAVDRNAIFNAFYQNFESGYCTYNIDKGFDGDDGKVVSGYSRSTNAYWPSDAACSAIVGRTFQYRSDRSLQVDQVVNSYHANESVLALGFYGQFDDPWNHAPRFFDRFFTNAVAKNTLDQYMIVPVNSKPTVKVMKFGWCGEEVDITYSNTTLAPTTAKAEGSYPDGCSGDFFRDAGGYDVGSNIFFMTNTQYAYHLPLRYECTDYSITIDKRSHNDWISPGLYEMDRIDDQADYSYQWRNSNDNSLRVDLKLNNERKLSDIRVRSADGSGNVGGLIFTINCIQPDPDQLKTSCTAPYAWDDRLADTENPCCGNDPDDEGTVNKELRCVKENDVYKWDAVSNICSYPSGWKVDGNEQKAKDTASSTYLPGAPLEEACCSDPKNFGRVTNASDGKQVICTVNATGGARWMKADAVPFIPQVIDQDKRSFASDGNQWLSCNTPAPAPFNISINTTVTIRDAGACRTPASCDQQKQQCINSCDPDDSACIGLCDLVDLSCPCPFLTTCSSNRCSCGPGYTWNGSQCNSACGDLTWNATSGKCEGTYLYTPPSVPPLESKNACEIVRMSSNSPQYICHLNWSTYNTQNQYFLNSTRQPIANTAPVEQVKYLCNDGDQIEAIARYNATKAIFGFCAADECYYGPTINSRICVPKDTWMYNDYCAAQGANNDWETRTRFLADALFNTTNNGDFVLHCDVNREAIETSGSKSIEIIPYEGRYLNGFCVLTKNNKVTVGVTLNTVNGNGSNSMPAIQNDITQSSPKPFITKLNNSREFGNFTREIPCSDLSSAEYRVCDLVENSNGKIYYNNLYGTLVFAQYDFNPAGNFLTPLTRWWNGVFNGETEQLMPLSGQKIYMAKKGNRLVQGRVYYVIGGTQEAKIISKGIDATQKLCEARKSPTSDKYDCSTVDGYTVVTIKRPTQAEWEDFTLRIRP